MNNNYSFADINSGAINTSTTIDNEEISLNHNLIIKNSVDLIFSNNSTLNITDSKAIVTSYSDDHSHPIVFNNSTLKNMLGATLKADILLNNGFLLSKGGFIKSIDISGDITALVDNTAINTINFTNTMGRTDRNSDGVGLQAVTVNTINVNFNKVNNNANRQINFKDASIDQIIVDHQVSRDDKEELKTNFNFLNGNINKFQYIGSALAQIGFKERGLGEFNFTNTKINKLDISFELLRNLTFNGGSVNNLNIFDPSTATAPTPVAVTHNSDSTPTPPNIPALSNLQLLGDKSLTINNFDLNSTSYLYIAGDKFNTANEGSIGSVNIEALTNYNSTSFSLYSLKEATFGKHNASSLYPAKGEVGGNGIPLQFIYINNVNKLNLYNQTFKLTIPYDPNTKNVDVYGFQGLSLYNSLWDVSRTKTKDYDLGIQKSYFTEFTFYNSGVINADTLRLSVNGKTQFEIYDMLSNLAATLKGENNIVYLKSNANHKTYLFNTEFNYCFIKPVDSSNNGSAGCESLDYNYWNASASNRYEQNDYEFYTDIVVAPLKGALNNLGNKVKGDIWFTYKQPLGDKCAHDQDTNGDGRGGFPCEFGSKIAINNGTTTFLKAVDNLSVVEILNKGVANFADIKSDELSDTWIGTLRMRDGILSLGTNTLHVDKLDIYTENVLYNPTLRVNINRNSQVTGGIVVNESADFHENKLSVDLFFNNNFIDLNNPITVKLITLGDYLNSDGDISLGTYDNFEGLDFAQGIMFNNSYYWENDNLYARIIRVHDFSYWFSEGTNLQTAKIFDRVINNPKYQISTNFEKKQQFINKGNGLSNSFIQVINALFRSKSSSQLIYRISLLRPVSNKALIINNQNVTNNIERSFNTKNYTLYKSSNNITLWSSYNFNVNETFEDQNNFNSEFKGGIFSLGIDKKFPNTVLGSSISSGNLKMSGIALKGNNKLIGLSVYSKTKFKNNYYLNLSEIYLISNYLGSRPQDFINQAASFKIKSHNNQLLARFGRSYSLEGINLNIFSFTGLGLSKVNSYDEDKKSYAALAVSGDNSLYYKAGIGVSLFKFIHINRTSLVTPHLSMNYDLSHSSLNKTKATFINFKVLPIGERSIEIPVLNNSIYTLYLNAGLGYSFKKSQFVDFSFNIGSQSQYNKTYGLKLSYKYYL